jgi:hypothetical protein
LCRSRLRHHEAAKDTEFTKTALKQSTLVDDNSV